MIIADMDGTVLSRWSVNDYEPRPGPYTGSADAILTNQGGVALKWAGLSYAKSYYGLAVVLRRVQAARELSGARLALISVYSSKQLSTARGRFMWRLGLRWSPLYLGSNIYVSLSSLHRKPAAGGILWLAERLGVLPDQALMIGDSTDDRLAAENAGVKFQHAGEPRDVEF